VIIVVLKEEKKRDEGSGINFDIGAIPES